MEDLVIDGTMRCDVCFEKLKKEHFNVKWIYVLKSASFEGAQEVLAKAVGSDKFFFYYRYCNFC